MESRYQSTRSFTVLEEADLNHSPSACLTILRVVNELVK